ncbi:hypothetical protein ACYSNR_08285 [Enterococcus sp. LJL128]
MKSSKRTFSIAVICTAGFVALLLFFISNRQNNRIESNTETQTISGTVAVSADSNSILVEGDLVTLQISDSEYPFEELNLVEGDTVEVTFSGAIQETYPSTINGKISSIKKL